MSWVTNDEPPGGHPQPPRRGRRRRWHRRPRERVVIGSRGRASPPRRGARLPGRSHRSGHGRRSERGPGRGDIRRAWHRHLLDCGGPGADLGRACRIGRPPLRPRPARRLGAASLPARFVPGNPGPPGRARLRPCARRGRGAPRARGSLDGWRHRHGRGRGDSGRFRGRAHGGGRAGALGAADHRGHLHCRSFRAGNRHGRSRPARRHCPSRIPGRCGRCASGRRRIAPHPRSLRRGRHVRPRRRAEGCHRRGRGNRPDPRGRVLTEAGGRGMDPRVRADQARVHPRS